MINNRVYLEACKRTDPRYQEIRNRHYVANNGTHGQQIHFIIWYLGKIVGIISGASAVYGVKSRDDFFKIPKNKEIKQSLYLPAIVNNTVFRLEFHEKNLATRVLSKWRKVIRILWEQLYGVPVIGFETFVVETDTRKGALYKADNWTYGGMTAGSTKHHSGLINPSTRKETSSKLTYYKWVGPREIVPKKVYVSSWRNETEAEKSRRKEITRMKENLIGKIF